MKTGAKSHRNRTTDTPSSVVNMKVLPRSVNMSMDYAKLEKKPETVKKEPKSTPVKREAASRKTLPKKDVGKFKPIVKDAAETRNSLNEGEEGTETEAVPFVVEERSIQ